MHNYNSDDDQENENLKAEESSPPSSPVATYGSLTTLDKNDPRAVPLLKLPRSLSSTSYRSTATKKKSKREEKYSDDEGNDTKTETKTLRKNQITIDIKHMLPTSQNITPTLGGLEEIKVVNVSPLVPHLVHSWVNNEPLPQLIANQLSSLSEREALTVEYAAFDTLLERSNNALTLIRQAEAEEKRKHESRWCVTRWFCTTSSLLYQKGLLLAGSASILGVGIMGYYLWDWTQNFDSTDFPFSSDINIINLNMATALKFLDHLINVVVQTRFSMIVAGAAGLQMLLTYHIVKACLIKPREKMENKLQTDFKLVQSKLRATMDVIQRQNSIINLNESKLNQVSEQKDQLMAFVQTLASDLKDLQDQVDGLQPSESKSDDAPPPPSPPPSTPDVDTAGYGVLNMRGAMNRVGKDKGTPSRVSSNSSSVFSSSSTTTSSRVSSNSNSNFSSSSRSSFDTN